MLPRILTEYPAANASTGDYLNGAGGMNAGWGQSFTVPRDFKLTSAYFRVYKIGTPTNNFCYKIYESTSGTFGTDAVPSKLIATSVTQTSAASTFPTTATDWPLAFVGENQVILSPGKTYIVTIENTTAGTGNTANTVVVMYDTSTPTAAGNFVVSSTAALGSWGANNTIDMIFGVSGVPYGTTDEHTVSPNNNYSVANSTTIGQSFKGDGQILRTVTFKVNKGDLAHPAGAALTARLYGHSGTYGTSSVRSVLVASSASILWNTLPLGEQEVTFEFTEKYPLVNGTNYVIAFSTSGFNASTNSFLPFTSGASATHGGNVSDGGNTAQATYDLWFRVNRPYSPPATDGFYKDITLALSGSGNEMVTKLLVGASSGAAGANFHIEGRAGFPTGKDNSGYLRFTDAATGVEYPFWVESVTSNVATVWVKLQKAIDSTTPSTIPKLRCWYGNAKNAVNVSNGDKTFRFFDDFDSTVIHGGKWSVSAGDAGDTIAQSNGELRVNNNATTPMKTIQTIGITSRIEGGDDFDLHYRMRSVSQTNGHNLSPGIMASNQADGNGQFFFRSVNASTGNGDINAFSRSSGTWTAGFVAAAQWTYGEGYTRWNHQLQSTTHKLFKNFAQVGSNVTKSLGGSITAVRDRYVILNRVWNEAAVDTADIYYDWIFVKSAVEPTYSAVTAEKTSGTGNMLMMFM